ncbi:MAG: RagB/SusD family nutrient uptake outer membrane protein [Sphingobacterium sp.]
MKLKYILLSLGVLSMSSCNHLLDVDPHEFSSGDSYYQNEGQVLRAINGVYSGLQVLYTSDFNALTEMRADNTNYQYDETDRGVQQREEIDEFLINSSNSYVNTAWANLYNIVQQTNVILSRIEEVPFTDEDLKQRYIGETKFIRALTYFHLVRLFGEVPLHTEEVANPSDAFADGKATVEETYALIIADTQEAVSVLPESYGKDDAGRVTKGAALTLLGETYLTRQQYQEAADALEQVTTLGYSLMADYADCFSPNHKNNAESVFEVQYDQSIEGENSNFIFMFGPRNAKMQLVGFAGNLAGTNIPTPSIYDAYESGDQRRDKSIELFDDPSNAAFQEAAAFDGKIPFIKKFYHAPYIEDGRSNENMPIYRYAYVLLMLAEARNESGSGDPYVHLNAVRERAGLDPVSGLSQTALREAIAHEQRVEVAFENHRWFQLLRTDKALEIMTTHGEDEKERLSRLSAASYNLQPFKLLFPIPQREVQVNGIAQNEGW